MDPEKSAFTVGKKIVSSNSNIWIANKNGSGRNKQKEEAVCGVA
jgi:hypothetical protein